MRWRSAVELALTLFGVFLTVAPALAPDQKKLAAEINNKTLKAAAAIKISPRPPLRVQTVRKMNSGVEPKTLGRSLAASQNCASPQNLIGTAQVERFETPGICRVSLTSTNGQAIAHRLRLNP